MFRFFKEVRTVNGTIKSKNFVLGYQKNLNIFSDDKTQANMPLLKGSAKASIKTEFLFSSNKPQKANSILKVQTRAFSSETSKKQMEAFSGNGEDVFISLEKEAILDAEITAHNMAKAVSIPKNILLTGATGFVGKHLLIELLKTSDANIYCLSREKSVAYAAKKLKESLLLHGLWHETYSARVVPVLGDISQPFLGMQGSEFNKLSKVIDSIYHSAAVINFDQYDSLKQTNVIGTKEVLRFACAKKLKQVHHISTANVFSEDPCLASRAVSETTSVENEKHHNCAGYPSSKWVAEKLVFLAMKRKIPCNIYRLGLVVWNNETGKCEETQWFYKFIKSCLMLNAFPTELNKLSTMPMISVNAAAKAISLLSKRKTLNAVHHLWEPRAYSLEDISRIFHHEASIPLKPVSEWLDCLEHYNNTEEELPIVPALLQGSRSQGNALIKQQLMEILNSPTFNKYKSDATWNSIPLGDAFTLVKGKGVKMFAEEVRKNIKPVSDGTKQEVLLNYNRTANSSCQQDVAAINPIELNIMAEEQVENLGGNPKNVP